MNTRKLIKQLSLLIILSLIVLPLTGCFDLGGFTKNKGGDDLTEISDHDFVEYYKDYFETFDDIVLTKQDCSSVNYSVVNSFFNKLCINETRTWDSNVNCVEYNDYCFLAIKFRRDIKIDSISLSFKGKDVENDAYLHFYVFIINNFDATADYRTYDKWQEELNKENEEDRKSESDFDSLNIEEAYAERRVSINNNGWNSFTIGFLEKGNADLVTPYEFKKDDYFVLMFKENMGIGFDAGMSKIKFSSTNLIVRANDD